MSAKLYSIGAAWDYPTAPHFGTFNPRQPTTEIDLSNRSNSDLVWRGRMGSTFDAATDPSPADDYAADFPGFSKRILPGDDGVVSWFQLVNMVGAGNYTLPYAGPIAMLSNASPTVYPIENYTKIQELTMNYSSISSWIGPVRAVPGTPGPVSENVANWYLSISGSYYNGYVVLDSDNIPVGFLGYLVSTGQAVEGHTDYPFADHSECVVSVSASCFIENPFGSTQTPPGLSAFMPSSPTTLGETTQYTDYKEISYSVNDQLAGSVQMLFGSSAGSYDLSIASASTAKEEDFDSVTVTGDLVIDYERDETDEYVNDIYGRKVGFDLSPFKSHKFFVSNRVANHKYIRIKGGMVNNLVKYTMDISAPATYIEGRLNGFAISYGWNEKGNTGWKVGTI